MNDNVKRTIKVIDDLLKAGIGDSEKLESIKEKLEKKIRITAEDVEYIQEQREKLVTSKPEEPEITPSEKQPKVEDLKKPKSKKPRSPSPHSNLDGSRAGCNKYQL